MYSRSRWLLACAALALSTAAEPSASALGEGGQAKGFPYRSIALPQWAIAQPGSACATAPNALSPSSNQKECSSATARSNCGCTVGLHEVEKCTVPSFSTPSSRASTPAAVARNADATSAEIEFAFTVASFSDVLYGVWIAAAMRAPGGFAARQYRNFFGWNKYPNQ